MITLRRSAKEKDETVNSRTRAKVGRQVPFEQPLIRFVIRAKAWTRAREPWSGFNQPPLNPSGPLQVA